MKLKFIVCALTYNSKELTERFIQKIPERRNYDIAIFDDHSKDGTWDVILKYKKKKKLIVYRNEKNLGVGGNIKRAIYYALNKNYDFYICMAGNNKDDPADIPKFIEKINEGYDYVQGSRFAVGGSCKNTPTFRYVVTKLYPLVFYMLTGFKGTDALNGFRAYRLSIFDNKDINIWQNWLNTYECETYLHYKILKGGYKVGEVGVSKSYPKDKNIKYSHIRPFIDWWNILKPLVYLELGLKK